MNTYHPCKSDETLYAEDGDRVPIYISWVNPKTQRRERIYNYYDADTAEGRAAVESVLSSLSVRFRIPKADVPGFSVTRAEWRPVPVLRRFGDEFASEL